MKRTSCFVFVVLIHPWVAVGTAGEKEIQLIDAARRGDLSAVKQLVADGIDVNATSNFEITPLWQASSKGHHEVVQFLLEADADPNIRDEVWNLTPLMLSDESKIVSLLVKHGAREAAAKLRLAALSGSVEVVQAILVAKRLDEQSLASAKAQAKLGGHTKIAQRLDEFAGKALPDPPEIDPHVLKKYTGQYVSRRLEEVEVAFRDGQLTFGASGRSARQLIPRDERTFDLGSETFSFPIRDGKDAALERSSGLHKETYRRISERSAEIPARPAPVAADASDWRRDQDIAAQDTWPSFRGPGARGIAVGQYLPARWDVTTGEGLRWKTEIPGLANACPIVWKDKVFVTTAVSSAGNTDVRIGLYGAGDAANDTSKHSWRLYCVDRVTGDVLWHRVAHEGIPPVKRHLKSSQANSTPATDGKHVVTLFNSGQFSCFDMRGELLWETNLGVLDSGAFNDVDYQWGFASSPIIYQRSVIVQCDIQRGSFIAAFEIESGKEIWRMARDEMPSWGTPTIHETDRVPLLITNATNHARGYDARTGRELWKLAGNAAITVPTPIVGHGLAFVTSGYRPIQPIYAVRLTAVGDITLVDDEDSNEHIAWSTPRGGPYLPTPLLYGDYLYTCGNNGAFTCYEAKTGVRVYRARCGNSKAKSFTASLVAADGKIYATAESGVVMAIKAGPEFEIVSTHAVGEYCLSTPAIAGGLFIVRTQKHLVAIGSVAGEYDSKP